MKPAELEATYKAMGRAFERLAGWRVIVLSGNPAIERAIRRKPNVSHRLWNGALSGGRLLRYDFRVRRRRLATSDKGWQPQYWASVKVAS